VGNYSAYVTERDARLERLRDAKKRQDEEVERMRIFIDRFRYKATKAAQVQSRLKMLEKIVPIEVPPERKRVRFTFPAAPKSGRTVLDLKHVRKAYGTNVVFAGANVHVERGDRVALIGPNGAGKSTLMRLLSGVEPADAGERIEGHQLVMQYFAQDEATRLDPTRTVYETLESGSPLQMVPAIRTILGGFLFAGDDVHKKVAVLSGGERTRLAVARMLLRPANTLLLDEPTNHLDMDSKDVLLDALEDFGGTLILVSHDRYFIDKLATKIIDVGGGSIRVYPGGYEDYRWSLAQRATEVAEAAHKPVAAAPRPAPQAPTGPASASAPNDRPSTAAPAQTDAASREERKRQEAIERRRRRAQESLARDVAELEARIAEREATMKEIEAEMAAPGFYENHELSKPVIDRHQALMWELGDLMHRWEELQQSLESAQ
jgi:ATP-binding cassette subfamily F protein 3